MGVTSTRHMSWKRVQIISTSFRETPKNSQTLPNTEDIRVQHTVNDLGNLERRLATRFRLISLEFLSSDRVV